MVLLAGRALYVDRLIIFRVQDVKEQIKEITQIELRICWRGELSERKLYGRRDYLRNYFFGGYPDRCSGTSLSG